MAIIRNTLWALVAPLILGSAILIYLYFNINDYQKEGKLTLNVLDAPVNVYRDDNAIPYIEAQSLADALRTQGFIIGQERLYQVQLFRLLALGRLSEVFDERGVNNDTLVRLVNIKKIARDYLATLDQNDRDYYTHYIEGLNAYILDYQHEHPVETKLLGMPNEAWTLEDIVTLQLFQAWSTSSLWRNELLTQKLINEVGVEHAQQISQVSVNPKDGSIATAQLSASSQQPNALDLSISSDLFNATPDGISAGSNAWATRSKKSVNGKPIFVNSPHLPATTLPGFWLPMGLFTPELQAVGVTAPGSPGIGVGRTQHIAYGATVGGGDGVDLFIEQLDSSKSDHYIENGQSLPLIIRTDTFKVKTHKSGYREVTLRIRATSRGPLISDHGFSVPSNMAISLSWAMIASQTESLGSHRLLLAKNIDEAMQAMAHFPGSLSHVVTDQSGGIARISSGRIPIRIQGDGSHPLHTKSLSNNSNGSWAGRIPQTEMPKEIAPQSDWVATANQRIVNTDYPYEFSKDFAAAWRYRRLKQVMDSNPQLSVDDHWALINDLHNPMADKLVPLFAEALAQHESYAYLAQALLDWDRKDTTKQVAPTLFQLIHNHLARQTFSDELNMELALSFFDSVRFWQERLVLMLNSENHPWFDDVSTPQIETRSDILARAVNATIKELTTTFGNDTTKWRWGDLHTITFASPIIPGERMAMLFGAGTHPMFGSGQTLNRGKYKLSKAYAATEIDSVRIVVDLSDDQMIRSVIPGGTSGRYFQKELTTQVQDWLNGNYQPIWFDLDKVHKQAITTLRLAP